MECCSCLNWNLRHWIINLACIQEDWLYLPLLIFTILQIFYYFQLYLLQNLSRKHYPVLDDVKIKRLLLQAWERGFTAASLPAEQKHCKSKNRMIDRAFWTEGTKQISKHSESKHYLSDTKNCAAIDRRGLTPPVVYQDANALRPFYKLSWCPPLKLLVEDYHLSLVRRSSLWNLLAHFHLRKNLHSSCSVTCSVWHRKHVIFLLFQTQNGWR